MALVGYTEEGINAGDFTRHTVHTERSEEIVKLGHEAYDLFVSKGYVFVDNVRQLLQRLHKLGE